MIRIEREGLVPYGEALERQRSIFHRMVEEKKSEGKVTEETIIALQHPPVVTLGRHAVRSNVLFGKEELERRGVELFEIERGGDVTFHGPGQLVVYPLLDLERHRLGVHDYVDLLEQSVIDTIADWGIKGERVKGASGVWIGKGTPRERKICALGVKCSRYVTMHGLALNVNTDLDYFRLINPCGFIDKGVTSMQLELGQKVPFEEVRERLLTALTELLSRAQGIS